MEGDLNLEVETREPWRIQLNLNAAIGRDTPDQDAFVEVYNRILTYAEHLGLHLEFGYSMPMDRGDVIPGSGLDEDLRLSARPAMKKFKEEQQ